MPERRFSPRRQTRAGKPGESSELGSFLHSRWARSNRSSDVRFAPRPTPTRSSPTSSVVSKQSSRIVNGSAACRSWSFPPAMMHQTRVSRLRLPGTRAAARRALFAAIDRDSLARGRATQPVRSRPTVRSLPNNRHTRKLITVWRGCSNGRDHSRRPIAITCSLAITTVCRCGAARGWKPPTEPWQKRHEQSVILVDGPAVLKAKSPHGILDNHLFHDNVHPTLKGYVALAEAVLSGLKTRAAFGWPASTRLPPLSLRESPSNSTSMQPHGPPFATELPPITVGSLSSRSTRPSGSSGVIATVRRRSRIEAGVAPENTGVPGVGTPGLARCRSRPSSRVVLALSRHSTALTVTARCLANSTHRSGQI